MPHGGKSKVASLESTRAALESSLAGGASLADA
jgi:hypothetical protein